MDCCSEFLVHVWLALANGDGDGRWQYTSADCVLALAMRSFMRGRESALPADDVEDD